MAFNLWKQLKKRLRRGRRPLWTLGGFALWLAAVAAACGLFGVFDAAQAAGAEAILAVADAVPELPAPQPSVGSTLLELRRQGKAAAAVLHRIYVCGEETEPLGQLRAEQITELLREHPDWSAMMEEDGHTVRIEQRINDLSSHCKTNAYFGVDRDGNFSLYDGEPKEEKVIRTFFQLDVQYLESSLPQEELDHLSRGIRVSDIDEYNSVLSTFSDFAMNDEKPRSRIEPY